MLACIVNSCISSPINNLVDQWTRIHLVIAIFTQVFDKISSLL